MRTLERKLFGVRRSAFGFWRRQLFGVRRSAFGVGAWLHTHVYRFIAALIQPNQRNPSSPTPNVARRTPNLLPACLLFLLALSISASDADPGLRFSTVDPVVRSGIPFRCRVEQVPGHEPGRAPWLLHVGLRQGDREAVSFDVILRSLAQVRAGVTVALVPPTWSQEIPVQLDALLVSDDQRLVERATQTVPTMASLAADARRAMAQVAQDPSPLPRLWSEQAAEYAAAGITWKNAAGLATATAQLSAWTTGQRPASPRLGAQGEWAFTDPIDGSVQPFRLIMPTTGIVAVAVVLGDFPTAVRKSAWPEVPSSWRAAADAAQVALIEIYPAGDRAWTGAALSRAALALAEVRRSCPLMAAAPAALVGVGSGAAGAVAMIERDPIAWRGLALITPELVVPALPDDPAARWLAFHQAGQRPQHLAKQPVICSEALPESLHGWSTALERAGGAVIANLPPPDNVVWWRTIATNAVSPVRSPSALIALEPGMLAGVTVEALTTWGVEGLVQWDSPTSEPRTTGIIACDFTAVSGTLTRSAQPMPMPRKALGHACGPLAAYATAPFVVVVGTGEHAAARDDNQRLAERFITAWSAHAHGRPPVIRDRDFRARDWRHHHLVCIGNPRSNQVLAEVVAAEELPVAWDDRSVRCGAFTALRSAHVPLALCWPHRDDDGRLVVILDGGPSWTNDGLPLAGLPDLAIGDPRRPTMVRLFDGEWR